MPFRCISNGRDENVSPETSTVDHWRFLLVDVDHWHFLLVDIDHWRFLRVDVDQTDVFNWSTSIRLTFSTGRRQPDWPFVLVDVDQTDLLYWSTSTRLTFSTGRHRHQRSTLDVDRRRCRHPFLLMFSSRPILLLSIYFYDVHGFNLVIQFTEELWKYLD